MPKFTQSQKNTAILPKKQEDENFKPKKLIQDIATRWNSTFYMLGRLQDLKPVIASLSTEIDFDNLTTNEWTLLPGLIAILKPLEEITKLVSFNSSIVSEVIPNVDTLIRYFNKTEGLDAGLKTLKKEFAKNVAKRFEKLCDVDEYAFATCLYPRYKQMFFSENTRDLVKTRFQNFILQQEMGATDPPSFVESQQAGLFTSEPCRSVSQLEGPLSLTDQLHVSFWNCYDEAIMQSMEISEASEENIEATTVKRISIVSEINLYWKADTIPIKRNNTLTSTNTGLNDPLRWWSTNKDKFPTLQKYAKRFLSAPPTSVYSERMFSEAGQIYDNLWTQLTPDHAESLLFLKHNLPIINYQY